VAGVIVGVLLFVVGVASFILFRRSRSRRGGARTSVASVYNADPYNSPDHWEMDHGILAPFP
jgi:hypothetical protein